MRKWLFVFLILFAVAGNALAVPETVSVRVTDVTTSSFAVVWMTDVAAAPNVEVYADSAMTDRLADAITVTPMPDAPQGVAAAARSRGIMKIRVTGLAPNTRYYVRTVTVDPADPASIGYSGLQEVTTASSVVPYQRIEDGTLQGFANDLLTMKVYIQPADKDAVPGEGDLVILETPASSHPVSAFVGAGTVAPEGVLDLNNLFGLDMASLDILGGEKAVLSVYRGGTLSTLLHYRRLQADAGTVAAGEPAKGFFADFNLDAKVDDQDFAEFRKQYRTIPDDAAYNPDYDFVADPAGKIDAQDFARFAREYGRSQVE
ncbi:MAG: fibronectin type III domain-containing protein [Geobacter sp.]|nr:fibronectin type III domain-containing protein [Geobacter sp.]